MLNPVHCILQCAKCRTLSFCGRLERELEESGAGEDGEEAGEDKTAGGILVSMATVGEGMSMLAKVA